MLRHARSPCGQQGFHITATCQESILCADVDEKPRHLEVHSLEGPQQLNHLPGIDLLANSSIGAQPTPTT